MIHLNLYNKTKKGYQPKKFGSRAKAFDYCKNFGLELSKYLEGQKITIYTTSRGTQITCTSKDNTTKTVMDHLLQKLNISSNITPARLICFELPNEQYMSYLNNSSDHVYPFTVSLS